METAGQNITRKVLAIDDNQTNLILLKAHLKNMGLETIIAENAQDGIKLAIKEKPDLILLDVMMPDIDGYEACKLLKADARTNAIPVIFVSAKTEVTDKIKGLELGAVDYVAKPFDKGELKARIGIVLKMTSLQEKLLSLANTDELTGLYNRRSFFEQLDRELRQARLKGGTLGILMFDLDHFKDVNDTYGHPTGDYVLKEFAGLLQNNIYPLDIPARYGGEEFITIMPDTDKEKAMQAAEKLRKLVEEHLWQFENKTIRITSSVGVSTTGAFIMSDSLELVKRADTALYAAKNSGRNRIVCWDDIEGTQIGKVQVSTHNYDQLHAKLTSLSNQIRSQTVGTISAFYRAMEVKDPHLACHSENTQIYATAIAEEMKLPGNLTEQIRTAALLHDLGKLSIPNEILVKAGKLTEKELLVIRRHPAAAAVILEPIGIFEHEARIIRHHLERFDGTGYPDGLIGREINIGARVLAVANLFDVLTSNYAHRNAQNFEAALDEIKKNSGTQFDPEVVEAFLNAAEKHRCDWPLSSRPTLKSKEGTSELINAVVA